MNGGVLATASAVEQACLLLGIRLVSLQSCCSCTTPRPDPTTTTTSRHACSFSLLRALSQTLYVDVVVLHDKIVTIHTAFIGFIVRV